MILDLFILGKGPIWYKIEYPCEFEKLEFKSEFINLINIDFTRTPVVNGFYIGENPSLYGASKNLDNGNLMFPIYKSQYYCSNPGFYGITSYPSINLSKSIQFSSAEAGCSFVGSISSIISENSTIVSQFSFSSLTPSVNFKFVVTPWTPNNTFPYFGFSTNGTKSNLFVGNDDHLIDLSNRNFYVFFNVNSKNYTLTVYENKGSSLISVWNYSKKITSYSRVIAPAFRYFVYNSVPSFFVSVKTVIGY